MTTYEDHIELLRFCTCGSVDDGKSTLIGRLLYDSKMLMEDQVDQLEKTMVMTGEFNLANLTDGLRAEREQGITIDVAYRYFATPKRRFIVADSPGHVQYTRNMVTGASTANLSIILVDARKGVIEQTRRHSYLSSLLGIPHVVVCVNKMDLVDYSEEVFSKIRHDFEDFSSNLNIRDITIIPASALKGDNVVNPSKNMPWYRGPSLLGFLEDVHIAHDRNLKDPRFAVQYVVRPLSGEHNDFRGYAGQVNSGVFEKGDDVVVLPSGYRTKIKDIWHNNQSNERCFAPMSTCIVLEDDIDVCRGNMIVKENNIPYIAREQEAMICWMHQQPMQLRKKYVIKHTTNNTRVVIQSLDHKVDIQTLNKIRDIDELKLNEIGRVKMKTLSALMYDPYQDNHSTGAFIIIEPATHLTVGAGMMLKPSTPPPVPDFTDFVI